MVLRSENPSSVLEEAGGAVDVPSRLGAARCGSPLLPSACQLAFGGVSSGQLTPAEIMLIAVIFSFLLEHNQQIIYFSSFITEPL